MSSSVQPDVDSGKSKSPNRIICPVCHRKFAFNYLFKKHVHIHTGEKRFKCDLCEKRFTEKSTLTKHLRTHTGEKPYVCNTCQKAFTQSSHLKIHNRQHTGEKPYACIFCQRAFVGSWELKMHMRVHTQEKPYVCDICQRQFQHKCGLDYHSLKHSGEKPHPCEKCPKRFPTKYRLKLHVRNIHDSTRVRVHAARVRRVSQGNNCCYRNICPAPPKPTPYDSCTRHLAAPSDVKKEPHPCEKCPKRFSTKCRLKRHVRNTHDSARVPAAKVRRDSQGNNRYRNICPAPHKPTSYDSCTRPLAAPSDVKKKSRWRSILPAVPKSTTPLTVPVFLLITPQLAQKPATVPLE